MSDLDTVLEEYLRGIDGIDQVPEADKARFLATARACDLNPILREVYAIVQGARDKRRLVVVTGYEVYLKRADRTGALRGWKAWTEGSFELVERTKKMSGPTGQWEKRAACPQGDLRAIIEIHRADWTQAFRHEVFLDEYAQENEMWAAKPRTMLKKVAIAQGFRLAFPEQLAGMPYTSDELSAAAAAPELPPAADLRAEAKRLGDELGLDPEQRKAAYSFADRDLARLVADLKDRLAKKQSQPQEEKA